MSFGDKNMQKARKKQLSKGVETRNHPQRWWWICHQSWELLGCFWMHLAREMTDQLLLQRWQRKKDHPCVNGHHQSGLDIAAPSLGPRSYSFRFSFQWPVIGWLVHALPTHCVAWCVYVGSQQFAQMTCSILDPKILMWKKLQAVWA